MTMSSSILEATTYDRLSIDLRFDGDSKNLGQARPVLTAYRDKMRFCLLGPLVVATADGRPIRITELKVRALLVDLLLHVGQTVTTDRLIEDLWHDRSGRRLGTLQVKISQLRRALEAAQPGGKNLVAYQGQGYVLDIDPEALDTHRFRTLTQRARAAPNPRARAALLTEALALWRGPALADFADEAFAQSSIATLTEQRLTAWEDQAQARLELGEHHLLADELGELVAAYPLRERFREVHIRALYRAGRQTEALASYHELRELLRDELGLEPGPGLLTLHQAVLEHDPLLVTVPEESAGSTAAPARVPARSSTPAELPADTVAFTGRDEEVARLSNMLKPQEDAPRIAVLIGGGGVGKSALAVRAARLLAPEFPDGQLYLDLHGHTPGEEPVSASQALPRLLRSLGAEPPPSVREIDEMAGRLRSAVAGRRLLFLLDNAKDTAQVRPFLPGAPQCSVLVTSRRALAIGDAWTCPVDALGAADGLSLLRKLARPPGDAEGAEEVVRLCQGLPLALRIAAIRLESHPTWTYRTLARRLRPEHRRLDELSIDTFSVRASFAASYHDLADEPRRAAAARLFRLLGLLEGPDIAAPAAAALAGVSEQEAAMLLDTLVDAHLLRESPPGRFHMHDLMRLFARELAETIEPPQSRQEASLRILRHYRARTAQHPPKASPPEISQT